MPAPGEGLLIEHLRGGGYDCVRGTILPSSYPENRRHLILRVPRDDDARPEPQVATLEYVRRWTSIPVAAIEAVDFSSNNALGKPYVLQHRIPGREFPSVWHELSHSQRREIAKEVGRLINILLSVESRVSGTIEAATGDSCASDELPNVVPFVLTDANGDPIQHLEPENATEGATSRSPECTYRLQIRM